MPELRPYQLEDIAFLSQLKVSACFNEQRTGKTPTSLNVFKNHNKVLIICPKSAIFQWKEEFERWLGRPCVALVGTPAKKQKLLDSWTDGLVVSYGSLKTTKVSDGLVKEVLKHKPDAVILDEAHRIKDRRSAAAKAAFSCRKIPYRMALTGTPAHGKEYEIYSILAWLFPEKFSSYWNFIDEYFGKTRQAMWSGANFLKENETMFPHKVPEFQRFLATFSTQRKRREVMPWLPSKDYQQVKLPCTKEQLKYLNELDSYFETEHVIVQGVLDRLIRYRQICLHPALLELKGKSPKLDWVMDYLTDYPDKPTIIFSKFTSFLKILEKELHPRRVGVIIGETPEKERNRLKLDFQEGKLNLLLIQIDAGKEALTLDRAETCIFTDKYPPVGDIQQAEDRGVATTQDKANKPYTIVELMMKDTYDEQLYELLTKRKSETDIINDYKKFLRR